MTERPATVSPRTTLAEAWDLMRELDVRHMPVVERGTVIGMVSDRDLGNFDVVRVLAEEGEASLRRRLELPVSTIMSTDVAAAQPELEMLDIVALLLERRVGAVPVVSAGTQELLGIVSYVDVLRAMAAELEAVEEIRRQRPGARRSRPSGRRSR
ncbi:MAG TPA: CBS domain-containing protein [Methylomirabilota bacterium]|jgi:acetoin utilization protein AcuB|nr:CBS domain-containing protein [Methylomirabilota bacterium]